MPGAEGLAGEGKHEVEVEVVEAGFAGGGDGAANVVGGVDAAEADEIGGVEALGAEGDSVESGGTHGGEFGDVYGTGVAFAGDFGGG